LDGDDEGTGSCILIAQVERFMVAWNEQADDQSTTNVEEENTDVDTFDGFWDVAS
jgi:hypothetical protein